MSLDKKSIHLLTAGGRAGKRWKYKDAENKWLSCQGSESGSHWLQTVTVADMDVSSPKWKCSKHTQKKKSQFFFLQKSTLNHLVTISKKRV